MDDLVAESHLPIIKFSSNEHIIIITIYAVILIVILFLSSKTSIFPPLIRH